MQHRVCILVPSPLHLAFRRTFSTIKPYPGLRSSSCPLRQTAGLVLFQNMRLAPLIGRLSLSSAPSFPFASTRPPLLSAGRPTATEILSTFLHIGDQEPDSVAPSMRLSSPKMHLSMDSLLRHIRKDYASHSTSVLSYPQCIQEEPATCD